MKIIAIQAVATIGISHRNQSIGGVGVKENVTVATWETVFGDGVIHLESGGSMKEDGERSVEPTSIAVEYVDVVGDNGIGRKIGGSNDGESGVGKADIPRTNKIGCGNRGVIVVARKAVGIEGKRPAKDIAVVTRPAVDDFDVPSAVHGAADECVKGLIGVIKMSTHKDIGRIETVVVYIGGPIDDAVARGIGIARIGSVGPTIAPTHSGMIVGG